MRSQKYGGPKTCRTPDTWCGRDSVRRSEDGPKESGGTGETEPGEVFVKKGTVGNGSP